MTERLRGERLQIMLSPDELLLIDDFRFSKRMPSRAATVRELFRRGLAAEGIPLRCQERSRRISASTARRRGRAASRLRVTRPHDRASASFRRTPTAQGSFCKQPHHQASRQHAGDAAAVVAGRERRLHRHDLIPHQRVETLEDPIVEGGST